VSMGRLTFRALNPALGAEVDGFDPQAEHDDATWRELSARFDDRAVLVFRDVDLDTAHQHRLVERLFAGGRSVEVGPEVEATWTSVSNKRPDSAVPYGRLLYHSDGFWSSTIPSHLISLYGLEVDEPPVPTVFACTRYAWDTLPAELRARVDG